MSSIVTGHTLEALREKSLFLGDALKSSGNLIGETL
jgi:hypothetical protein